jgi:hypothetical protein
MTDGISIPLQPWEWLVLNVVAFGAIGIGLLVAFLLSRLSKRRDWLSASTTLTSGFVIAGIALVVLARIDRHLSGLNPFEDRLNEAGWLILLCGTPPLILAGLLRLIIRPKASCEVNDRVPPASGWYYLLGEQQIGPLTPDQFSELVQNGDISDDTMIWCDGMETWATYRDTCQPTSPQPQP